MTENGCSQMFKKRKREKLSRLNWPQKLQMLSHNQAKNCMSNSTGRYCFLCSWEKCLNGMKKKTALNATFLPLAVAVFQFVAQCASTWPRLTPSQHVVPEELLLPHKDGHDDERVEVDAFTQHPEGVGDGGVLVEQRQHLAADLQTRGAAEVLRKAARCDCWHRRKIKWTRGAHWIDGFHDLLVGRWKAQPDHGHDRVQDEREKCVFVHGDPLTTQTPAGGDREPNVQKVKG